MKLGKVCNVLGSALWGLVFAKARASFDMSDIVDRRKLKLKYNKIFYICIMIALGQILKSCADSSYADNLIDDLENKIDSQIFKV